MLFRAASLLGPIAALLLLAAAPEVARAHNHDKAATMPNLRVAAKDSDADAVKALTVGFVDLGRLDNYYGVAILCVCADLLWGPPIGSVLCAPLSGSAGRPRSRSRFTTRTTAAKPPQN